MKQLNKFLKAESQKTTALGLLVLRLGMGIPMLTHGIGKAMNFSHMSEMFVDPFGISNMGALYLVIFAELVCAILVAIGLFTRLAAIPVIITMATAGFIVHAADPWQRKELAFVYLFGFIAILIAGPGKYSLDKK